MWLGLLSGNVHVLWLAGSKYSYLSDKRERAKIASISLVVGFKALVLDSEVATGNVL